MIIEMVFKHTRLSLVLRLRGPRLIVALVLFAGLFQACSSPDYDRGVITAERATLRSTTARVATLSGEVKRGDTVLIEGQHSPWVRVRTMQAKPIEGWIDEKFVVSQKLVDESRKLLREVEPLPSQAIGRLKTDSRLRLKPAREDDDNNVLQSLRARTTFEILDKQRSPRPAVVPPDNDEATDTPPQSEPTKYDTWYKVRLSHDFVCRAGWILAGSAELAVPPEIQNYETGTSRFVGWQDVGIVQDSESGEVHNYVVFEKQIFGANSQADFDRIYGVGWDPSDHGYYSFYVESGLRGLFPVMRKTEGNNPVLILKLVDRNNKNVTVELKITKDKTGKLHAEKGKPVPA